MSMVDLTSGRKFILPGGDSCGMNRRSVIVMFYRGTSRLEVLYRGIRVSDVMIDTSLKGVAKFTLGMLWFQDYRYKEGKTRESDPTIKEGPHLLKSQ